MGQKICREIFSPLLLDLYWRLGMKAAAVSLLGCMYGWKVMPLHMAHDNSKALVLHLTSKYYLITSCTSCTGTTINLIRSQIASFEPVAEPTDFQELARVGCNCAACWPHRVTNFQGCPFEQIVSNYISWFYRQLGEARRLYLIGGHPWKLARGRVCLPNWQVQCKWINHL